MAGEGGSGGRGGRKMAAKTETFARRSSNISYWVGIRGSSVTLVTVYIPHNLGSTIQDCEEIY